MTTHITLQVPAWLLTVHPRTKLWWEQREKCKACTHCVRVPQQRDAVSMSCGASPKNAWKLATCILARDEGWPCGPNARLFQPKEASK